MRIKEKESAIEGRIVKGSKVIGYANRKMNGFGYNAWPDRLFMGPEKLQVWMEVKRPGEVPTVQQAHVHAGLRAMGHDVQVFDDSVAALAYLKQRWEEVVAPWISAAPKLRGIRGKASKRSRT